ncbi:hypothetical protein PR048_011435 [Dryococelus australis]|uniref:Uncharacterized protein n=1 Tax=Dryococelus australis TaxID=614101 RepID=A0ABQ9HLJ5_9NEOP|nr:hypothetical protein PR048_011435 [Dryococelus australis]
MCLCYTRKQRMDKRENSVFSQHFYGKLVKLLLPKVVKQLKSKLVNMLRPTDSLEGLSLIKFRPQIRRGIQHGFAKFVLRRPKHPLARLEERKQPGGVLCVKCHCVCQNASVITTRKPNIHHFFSNSHQLCILQRECSSSLELNVMRGKPVSSSRTDGSSARKIAVWILWAGAA